MAAVSKIEEAPQPLLWETSINLTAVSYVETWVLNALGIVWVWKESGMTYKKVEGCLDL
jgi:hypothetical protein